MRSTSGRWSNFTRTRVPPWKSTSRGRPCQKRRLSTPATLKISEKARKYHFLPSQSILTPRNSSTNSAYLLELERLRIGKSPGLKTQRIDTHLRGHKLPAFNQKSDLAHVTHMDS